jgi:hypothetical protein
MSETRARRGDGQAIHPGEGVVPILKEVSLGKLCVIGTGFYLTRYGLFATAKHVLEALVSADGKTMVPSFVPHLATHNQVHLRQIKRAHLHRTADVAIAQADNYVVAFPSDPLQNLRAVLSTAFPSEGAQLSTYAYPENDILDFTREGHAPVIRGDYFDGGFLRFVRQRENPSLKVPYFETTVELRPGASGGPILDSQGRAIGINCRGWDFRGCEHEADGHLSYIMPIDYILDLDIDPFMVPPVSWEAQQIPENRRGLSLTGLELARYGHILFDPPVITPNFPSDTLKT